MPSQLPPTPSTPASKACETIKRTPTERTVRVLNDRLNNAVLHNGAPRYDYALGEIRDRLEVIRGCLEAGNSPAAKDGLKAVTRAENALEAMWTEPYLATHSVEQVTNAVADAIGAVKYERSTRAWIQDILLLLIATFGVSASLKLLTQNPKVQARLIGSGGLVVGLAIGTTVYKLGGNIDEAFESAQVSGLLTSLGGVALQDERSRKTSQG